jgi:hypothetical protein
MLDRRPVHSRLVATTLRRIVALGLVVTIPAKHPGHRPNV